MKTLFISIIVLTLFSCNDSVKKESSLANNDIKKPLSHRDSIIEIMKQVTIHHKWYNIYKNKNYSKKIIYNNSFNFGASTEPELDIYIGKTNEFKYFKVYSLVKKGNCYNFKTVSLKTNDKTTITLNIVDTINDLAVIKIDTNLIGYFLPLEAPECKFEIFNCKHDKSNGY